MTPLRLRLLLGGAVLAILAGVVVFGSKSSDPATEPAAEHAADPVSVAQTSIPDAGEEVGSEEPTVTVTAGVDQAAGSLYPGSDYPRTESGALSAAVAMLELTEDIASMTPADTAQVMRSIATEASADRLASRMEQEMLKVAAVAPLGIDVWLAPVAARSIEVTEGYDVSIWHTKVVAIGTERVIETWDTVTYLMRWEAGEWRMEDNVVTPGPTPSAPATRHPTPAVGFVGGLEFYSDEGLVQ